MSESIKAVLICCCLSCDFRKFLFPKMVLLVNINRKEGSHKGSDMTQLLHLLLLTTVGWRSIAVFIWPAYEQGGMSENKGSRKKTKKLLQLRPNFIDELRTRIKKQSKLSTLSSWSSSLRLFLSVLEQWAIFPECI